MYESYMIWSDINRILSTYEVPLYILSYHSETAHIPLSLAEVSTLRLLPLAYMRTLETPYSSSMFHSHVIIGRGAPFTSRLPLVPCRSL